MLRPSSSTITIVSIIMTFMFTSTADSLPSSTAKCVRTDSNRCDISHASSLSSHDNNENGHTKRKKIIHSNLIETGPGTIEELKQREAELSRLLTEVRIEKLSALRSRPLVIGIMGFGRFGQFMAKTFAKHGRVVATSRSDYTDIANNMGVTYVPLSDLTSFLEEELDVIVLATSIVSFEGTLKNLATHLTKYIGKKGNEQKKGPLIVDVLSVKEHPRQMMLDLLPKECDIVCTHPMFGPDSAKNGWRGLNFVYERTRIDGVLLDSMQLSDSEAASTNDLDDNVTTFVEKDENSVVHIERMDRMERFLSIWEEEGCRMVQLTCRDHDAYAANSQFITHLMGRILGANDLGLTSTPIDTRGFQSVMKLVDTTTTDSFDLFYGLYKYNQHSLETIIKLRNSMDKVVNQLREMEEKEQ